jgi:ATP-dependent DNA helicase Rep
MNLLEHLNPEQLAAVTLPNQSALILAGAGSGKTRVLTTRIAWLIQTGNVSPQGVLAVTFTNKAAREMKDRVNQLLKGKNSRGLIISTFHHLGLTIIRKECGHMGLKSSFSIFDETDCLSLLKELMLKDVDTADDQLRRLGGIISRFKNQFLTPAQALAVAATPEEALAARVYEDYQRSLRAFNAVDFDDLILLPAQVFQDKPEVLDKWRRHIRYLLVDEYQDTNNMQYNFVKQLIGDRGCLTVVGDDDQSIYSWRGAKPENMSLLQEDYPSLNVIKLEQNYRSTNNILTAANALIANNLVLNTAEAEVLDSELTVLGSFGVEAENISTIEASNSATTESTGGTAAGVTLAFNTIGWEAQNILFAAIDALLGDPARREMLGRAARAHILASFCWRRAARSITALYERVLAADGNH